MDEKNLERLKKTLKSMRLFDMFVEGDVKVDGEHIRNNKCRSTYVSSMPEERLWKAWERWALAPRDKKITAIEFFVAMDYHCVFPILEEIHELSNLKDSTKNIFTKLSVDNLKDSNDRIKLSFTMLLWESINSCYENGFESKTVEAADLVRENAEQFMNSIGAPNVVRQHVCNMLYCGTLWDLSYDEMAISEITTLLSLGERKNLIKLLHHSGFVIPPVDYDAVYEALGIKPS